MGSIEFEHGEFRTGVGIANDRAEWDLNLRDVGVIEGGEIQHVGITAGHDLGGVVDSRDGNGHGRLGNRGAVGHPIGEGLDLHAITQVLRR